LVLIIFKWFHWY